jgi:hypothetical protein
MWYLTFTEWAVKAGYVPCDGDPCWFLHSTEKKMIIIYVDDMILAAENQTLLQEMGQSLLAKFQSRIMGAPTYFLGMNMVYKKEKGEVILRQHTYIEAIVEKYGLTTLLPRKLPMVHGLALVKSEQSTSEHFDEYGSLIGALLFLAVCTRPDIAFAVGVLSKFVSRPTKEHWEAAINVVAYLKGTKMNGIKLGENVDNELFAYADSDWAGDIEDRISVSGGMMFWGDSIISWFSRKQSMVCLSTAEAETHALVDVGKEVIYVQNLVAEILKFFDMGELQVPIVYTDNQPAIDAVLGGKGRTKHYDIRVKFLAKNVVDKVFVIFKVDSRDNKADLLTKVLRGIRFRLLAGEVMCGGTN